MIIKSIVVFCGSSDNVAENYLESARMLGKVLVEKNIRLIFGGSNTGLMGAISKTVIELGGEAIGIVPEFFYSEKLIEPNLTKIEIVEDMHTRKARMAELSDAFIALPGGFGTLEELFEAITWGQIGIQSKPVGILNVDGFYDTLLRFVEELEDGGFIYARHRNIIHSNSSVNKLVEDILSFSPPPKLTKW